MHKAIIYSHDLSEQMLCTLPQAHRLLGKGKARIVKFYPFSVQLKKPDFFKDADLDGIPAKPQGTPPQPLIQAKKPLVETCHD